MHFRLLRKLGVCFQLNSMNIIIINIYQMPQSACYFRNNSLRNYKLTLLGLTHSNYCSALLKTNF